jgi:hypothetical protein
MGPILPGKETAMTKIIMLAIALAAATTAASAGNKPYSCTSYTNVAGVTHTNCR